MNCDVGMIVEIDFVERPNNEDPAMMMAYAQIQRTLYLQQPNLGHYRHFWETLSSNTELIDEVMKIVEEMLEDHTVQEKIRGIYPRVLEKTFEN